MEILQSYYHHIYDRWLRSCEFDVPALRSTNAYGDGDFENQEPCDKKEVYKFKKTSKCDQM